MPFCLRGTVWVQFGFETVLHEATHGTEGTAAWFGLSNQLRGLEGGKVYNEMLKQLGNRGYFNGKAADIRAEVENIARKLERGEALTDKQTAFAEDFMSESVAIMAEQALGNEHFARELLDADASVVEKLLHRIEDVKEALARRKDAAAKEAFEEVRKAEGAFLEALAEKGMAFVDGKIIGANEEDEEKKTIDKSKKGGYNKPKRLLYIRIDPKEYAVLQSQVMSQQSEYIAKNESLPNSFCAYTANFFYIYDNWEPGKFGVRKQILITDANQEVLKSIERELNGEAKFIRSASDFDRRFKILERESRRYQRSGTPNSRELADSGNGELSTEKQGGIGERNSRGSSSDQRDGGVKKSRKANSQTSGKNTEKSYRYYRSPQKVMSAWGHAMFVDDPYSSETYGDFAFGVEHSELVRIDELRDEILAKMKEDYENGELPEDMEYAIDQNGLSFDELADEYAPEDIVMSAQGWDNGQFVEWFYNRIIEPKDIKGIKTPDGAIVFDETIISRETDFDHGKAAETAVKKSRKANSQTSGKTSASPSEVSHLTAMQKQTVANYARTKVYTKADSKPLVLLSLRNKKGRLMPSFFYGGDRGASAAGI